MLRPSARRPGQTGLFALIAVPVLLGVLLLLVYLFRTRDSLIELRNGGVAAALAGVEDLADDARLTDHPDRLRPVFARARRSAADVARHNFVEGRPLELRLGDDGDSPDHEPRDVVLGTVDRAVGGRFEPFRQDAGSPGWGRVNAVEVTVRHPAKPDVFTRVVGVLDDAVVGFRPWADRPAPLVPVALYDGPDDDHATWREAVKRPTDDWAFDPDRRQFVPGKDGVPEVRVRVGRMRHEHAAEVCGLPLLIGGDQPRRAVEQVLVGLTEPCLAGDEGEFRLRDDHTRPQPGSPDLFAGDRDGPAAEAFRAIVGQPRVWPVFGGVDDDGRAVLSGFTGARVAAVERETGGGLVLVLQPAVVASPTAVTRTEPVGPRPEKADKPAKPAGDRTVVKVRLAG